jgi:allantoate deiminase
MLAEILMSRAEHLATFTEEPGKITRRYGTPALAEVMTIVEGWMRDAGMSTRRDAIGNLFGLQTGTNPSVPRLLIGGHLDSVRDAGRYDGILGVLSAIAVVEGLRDTGTSFPFGIEVAAFADEEGVRFHSLYLGSSSAAGTMPAERLDAIDADGISVRDAISSFGFDPGGALTGSLTDHEYLGFIEAHIEQGSRLEAADLPVGIVSGIVGTQRAHLDVFGTAGHAGTVAMEDRQDALVAMADIILGINEIGSDYANSRATVGEITVKPGASNVIPGEARIGLDIRHPDDTTVAEMYDRIRTRSAAIAARRQVEVVWRTGQKMSAMSCNDNLNGALATAIEQAGFQSIELFSGAGHDAAALDHIMPVTMLFVRCKDGISHNPAESIWTEDAGTAIDVLVRFIHTVASFHTS